MIYLILNLTIDDVINRYDNLQFVKANVIFYYKLGIVGNSEYERAYYNSLNKDIWKGEMIYQNNAFNYKFITKKGKGIELYLSGNNENDYMFEFKYEGKVQAVNAFDWAYFMVYKMPKILKEHNYEISQNGNWFVFKKGIRELRMLIDNNYRILSVEYYKRGAIMGILKFSDVQIE